MDLRAALADAGLLEDDYTPCDNPYPDCKVCSGTGKHPKTLTPCDSCVWRRWFEAICKDSE